MMMRFAAAAFLALAVVVDAKEELHRNRDLGPEIEWRASDETQESFFRLPEYGATATRATNGGSPTNPPYHPPATL